MSHTTLQGCLAKVDRADELLTRLGEDWHTFLNTQPYAPVVNANPVTGWERVSINVGQPGPAFSVLAGEIAHELRTALDHIVFGLATKHLDRIPTEKEARGITFPVAVEHAHLDGGSAKGYLSEDAWALIEQFQPYRRVDDPVRHPLCAMHRFNRADKHRSLHPIGVFPEQYSVERVLHWNPQAELLEKLILAVPGQRPIGQTEIARLRFAPWNPVGPGIDPQVSVEGKLAMRIEFGETGEPSGDLGDFTTWTRAVVWAFAHLLEGT